MLGNDSDAIRHMRMGRSLAQAFHSDRCLPCDHPFQIAKIWLSMGGVDRSGSTPRQCRIASHEIESPASSPGSVSGALPMSSASEFASLQEAGTYLEVLEETRRKVQTKLFEAASSYLSKHYPQHSSRSAKAFSLTHCLARVVIVAASDEFSRSLEETIGSYLSWKASLDRILRSQRSPNGHSLLLQIRYFNALFSLCNCRETRESATDQFRDGFIEVLDNVENFLEHWSGRALHLDGVSPELSSQQALRGTGIFEFGPLPALATVAVKCRDSNIRRRAISMLFTARRREGNHSSLTLSLWADTIAALEDERAAEMSVEQGVTEVPETARFSDAAVCADEHDESIFHVYTARFEHEQQGDIELTKYSRAVNGVFGTAFQTIRTPCEPRTAKDLGGEIRLVYREKLRRPSSIYRTLA